jgi:hypothetical protein
MPGSKLYLVFLQLLCLIFRQRILKQVPSVLWIWIHKFLGLPDLDPLLFVQIGSDQDPDADPPIITKKK